MCCGGVLSKHFVFYTGKMIKQLLVEKELESKNLQLLAQSTILEQKNQLIEEQKSLIGDELMVSRRQLTATALMLARKRDANDLLKTEVSNLEAISSVAKNKLLRIIDQIANEEDEWGFFQQQFEQLEPFFLQNILHDFPALTPSDLKILTLIRMNVDSKEISTILRISTQSTNTARYRLRKRLGLLEEESLENFVLSYLC